MPGLGDSDPPDDVRDVWSVTHCVEDGDRRRCCPGTRQFFLTGFSFGGMVSGHLATLIPERIKRIVFVGAGGLKATRKPDREAAQASRHDAAAAAGRRGAAQSRTADAARPEEDRWRGDLHADHEHDARPDAQPRHGHQGVLSYEVLPKVTTPFTGIWGEFDSTTYPYIQERIDLFTALQPDFRMHVIPRRRSLGCLRGRRGVQCQAPRGARLMKTERHRDRRQDLSSVDVRAADRPDRLHLQPVPDRCRRAAAVPLRPSRDVSADLAGGRQRDPARETALDDLQPRRGATSSGALNEWLAAAPNATPAHGQVGVNIWLTDMANRGPRTLKNDEVIDLGGKQVRWLDTPHVPHNWDAGLIYEETTGTLFSSDLFTQAARARDDHDRRHRRRRRSLPRRPCPSCQHTPLAEPTLAPAGWTEAQERSR